MSAGTDGANCKSLSPTSHDHHIIDLNNNDPQMPDLMKHIQNGTLQSNQAPIATPENSLLDFDVSLHDESETGSPSAFESVKLSVQIGMSPKIHMVGKTDAKLQAVHRGKEPRTRFISITSTDSVFCRICHQGESKETLIRPCKCAGTIGAMHQTCVEQWLGAAGTDQCEICGHGFLTERRVKPFSVWLCESLKSSERKNLFTDTLCFAILTPLVTVSIWLCINGAMRYYKENPETYFWETVGLSSLTVFLLLIYFVWFAICVRYHRKMYINWREKNQFVRVLDYSNYLKNKSFSTPSKSQMTDDNNNTENHHLLQGTIARHSVSDSIVSLGNSPDTQRVAMETRTGSLHDIHRGTPSTDALLTRTSLVTTNV